MEQVFASLSKRQTMLLLTSLAFGGSGSVESFAHLAPEEEELLKFRAQTLIQIPREKRVPLLIQEIKRLLTQRKRQLGGADSRELAALLKNERTAMIEVVLRALPVDLADAVRSQVGVRPTVKLRREVKPDILSIIRWKIEDGLKSRSPNVGSFRFADVMTLQQRELIAICDRMGARVLSSAFAGLSAEDRDALFAKLPPDQRTLALRAAEAAGTRRLSEDDAKTVLDMHGANENPSLGMRSAGVQRVVRASVAQSPEFAQRLAERHPGELGKLILKWFREERARPVKADGGRADIVEQMERLSQRGVIDKPMRIPPPVKALPKQAAQAAQRAANPPPVRTDSGERKPPPSRGASGEKRPPPRVSQFQAPIVKPGPPVPTSSEVKAQRVDIKALQSGSTTDRQVRLQSKTSERVLRDGKPLERVVTGARKALAPPVTGDLPRRKTAGTVGASRPAPPRRPKRGS